jgi:hypothetical protein
MALRHENRGKETANMSGGTVKEIASASRESDPEKSCILNGVRKFHGVDRLVEWWGIQTPTVDLHVRMSVGRSESGRGAVNVWQGRSGRERCR